jgi:UDP-N-acetylglucosamine 2-epimerase
MNVKVIMSWDIVEGREQEYFEFVVRNFMPGVQKLGMALSDAWVTIYGDQPQILVGAVVPGLEKAQNIIHSEAWLRLNHRLLNYVKNYELKVAPLEGGFQF